MVQQLGQRSTAQGSRAQGSRLGARGALQQGGRPGQRAVLVGQYTASLLHNGGNHRCHHLVHGRHHPEGETKQVHLNGHSPAPAGGKECRDGHVAACCTRQRDHRPRPKDWTWLLLALVTARCRATASINSDGLP